MAKSARFSDVSKPLPRPATIMIGIFAVSGLLLSAPINSVPDIRGIFTSVMIRSGCTRARTCNASTPFVADSTANPRSSRKRHTVYRISMESSTTRATFDIFHGEECTHTPGPEITNVVLAGQGLKTKLGLRWSFGVLADYNP